ncbi:MAG: TAXI family TRAP transporter solute-binding subunit, partial [Polaromonas sp.]
MAKLYQRKWLLIRLPLVLAAVAVATWLWVCVWPMPPTRLSISTAQTDGAYYLHAQRYAEKFAQRGVTLEILNSAGSEENLRRLRQPEAPADLALIQGGFGYLGASFEGIDRSRVQTLANVDVEPVWLFSRNRDIESLNQLQGLRLAIGPEGSGHRRVALRLLEQARIGSNQL